MSGTVKLQEMIAEKDQRIADLERLSDSLNERWEKSLRERDEARAFAVDMRNLNIEPDDPDIRAPWETKP